VRAGSRCATVALAIASGAACAQRGSRQRRVIRLTDDGYRTRFVANARNPANRVLHGHEQFVLQAGDIIVVPESGRSQFVRSSRITSYALSASTKRRSIFPIPDH